MGTPVVLEIRRDVRYPHADKALNQRQKKSLVRLRSSSCEATVWTEAGIDLRNTAPLIIAWVTTSFLQHRKLLTKTLAN